MRRVRLDAGAVVGYQSSMVGNSGRARSREFRQRGGPLSLLLLTLAECTPAPRALPPESGARPVVSSPLGSAGSAAVEALSDRGASLAVVEERDFPRIASRLQSFAEGGGKWWLNEEGVPKLFGLDGATPERVVNSLYVAVADVRRYGLALSASEDGVFAASLADGKEVFRVPFRAPPAPAGISPPLPQLVRDRGSLWGVSATAGELALAVESWEGRALVVVDRTSGATLWQAPARWQGYASEPALDSSAVYLRSAEAYEARSARSGERLWAIAAPAGDASPHLHGDAVVLALRSGERTLVETRSGQERCSVAVKGEVEQSLSWGEQLVLETSEGQPALSRLIAVDGKACRTLWTSAPFVRGARLQAARDHLLLWVGDRVLLLDRRGVVVWHYGIGNGEALAFEEQAGAPRLALLSGQFAPHSLRIFAARAEPDPLEKVRVRGKITRDGQPAEGVRVAAYGSETRSNAQGRYELVFSARGAVTVTVDEFGDSSPFALTGKGEYEVDIDQECRSCD